jgi:uncharacterized protein (TIGR02599 family)
MMCRSPHSRRAGGFTLIEMLVSVAVLTILVLVLTSLISSLRMAISGTSYQIGEFEQARDAFETMTRRISQATLNAYDDSDPHLSGTNPYVPASELRFICGIAEGPGSLSQPYGGLITTSAAGYPTHAIFFQAPLGYTLASGSSAAYAGLLNLMNTVGYFIEWNSDSNIRPGFLNKAANPIPLRYRMRLMELIEPSDYLTIYNYTSGPETSGTTSPAKSWFYNTQSTNGAAWFQTPLTATYQFGNQTIQPSVHTIAENIMFLMILPMVAPQNARMPPGGNPDGTSTDIAPNYTYDSSPSQSNALPASQNQLPPMVYIMMIAVDEKSFARYQAGRPAASAATDPTSSLLGSGVTGSEGMGFLTNAAYQYRIGTPASPGDVTLFTNALTAHGINYRIFTAGVPLTGN